MTLQTHAKASIYLTVGLGIGAYCVAEQNALLAAVALPLWAAAWPLSLGRRGRPAPRAVLVAIALALSAYAVYEIVRAPGDVVASISRFIVWLQIVLLFDRAGSRERGQTLSMSVFLVLGACLTSNSLWLGLSLLAYAPSALWAVTLHQLSAEESRVTRFVARTSPGPGRAGAAAESAAMTRGSRRALRRVWAVSGVSSGLLAAAMFLALPRGYGQGFLGDIGVVAPAAVSGLPQEVQLGDAGLISTSRTIVLEMETTDERGLSLAPLLAPMRLRAVTMDLYEDGRWRTGNRSRARLRGVTLGESGSLGPFEESPDAPKIRQRLRLRRDGQENLPALNRPVRIEGEAGAQLQINAHDFTLRRASDEGVREIVVWSQEDAPRTLINERLDWRYQPAFGEGPVAEYAARVMAAAGLERDRNAPMTDRDHEIAREFERALMRDYRYTGEMRAPLAGEDPIAMFLTRTRVGHCEYFAAALAAMLRSVGIDSRVVTGYMATEIDPATGWFVVRESHAHAWVEARTAPGVWRTYDASPAEGVARAQRGGGVLATLRDAVARAEAFWVSAVVGYDQDRQRAALGDESSWVRQFFNRLWPEQKSDGGFGVDARKGILAALKAVGVGAGFVAAVMVVAAVITRIAQAASRRRSLRDAARADPSLPGRLRRARFFARMQKELRRAGLARPVWRPALEHARGLSAADEALGLAAQRLTELYYAARFGRRTLSEADMEEGERLLGQVRARTGARRGRRR